MCDIVVATPLTTMTSSFLKSAALRPATLRTYDKNLSLFLQHIQLPLQHLLSLPVPRIDQLFSQYLEHQYSVGGSFDSASHAFHSLLFRCPSLRLQLGESRVRLRGWSHLKQSSSHPPITWELTVCFATTFARWGHYPQGVASLVAFDCYLRVGELTRIRYCDVIQPSDPRVGSAHATMAVRLPITKTGRNQWVSIQRSSVAQVLLHYLRSRPFRSTDLIFPFTPTQFRRLIRSVSLTLGVGHTPYVPHSFRHGGATCDYLSGRTIEQIMFHGRWKSMESARRYIQAGRAILVTCDVPPSLHTTGLVLAPVLVSVMQTTALSVRSASIAGVRAPREGGARRVRFARDC